MNGCDVCYFGIADTATHPILTEFAVMDHKSDYQVDNSRADWVSLYAPRFDIPDNWDEQLEQSPPTECGNDGPFNEQSLEHKQGVYRHTCPDSEAYPTFPYGPLLRACGSCEEPIPMSCAFCERVSEQPCNTVYRVALTGADWHGFRSAHCPSRETGVLVKCTHCAAPGEFHIHLALFKGYYSEVLDLVREGRISLFDVRRSVNVVAEWPPHPDRPLIRLISHLANELSASLAATPLPNACGALVFAYWQGAGPDYLLEETTFTNSFDEMYACNHGWPCLKDDGSRQYCLWTQWAQQWIHELVVCDGRAAIPRYYSTNHLPRTWDEWIERRAPEWLEPDGRDRSNVPIPIGGLRSPRAAYSKKIPTEGYRVLRSNQLPGHRPLGLMKLETRITTAWYTLFAHYITCTRLLRFRASGAITQDDDPVRAGDYPFQPGELPRHMQHLFRPQEPPTTYESLVFSSNR